VSAQRDKEDEIKNRKEIHIALRAGETFAFKDEATPRRRKFCGNQ